MAADDSPGLGPPQFLDGERRRLDVEIDAVEQRAADARAVALDLRGRAAALMARVAEVAAGAGVHRRDEHEAAGQRDLAGAARDGDLAVLQRLAHDLERGAFEFRQLVEKQHAVVGEGDFAGAGDGAAAEQADVGDRVVGGAEGARQEGQAVAERAARRRSGC